MNIPIQSKLYSIEDYLEFEAKSELRHEYEAGLILEMSGGSINHGRICGNAYAALRQRLRGKNADCEAFPNNIKVRLEAINQFVYPDTIQLDPASVNSMIKTLEKKGFIEKTPSKARSIKLLLSREELPDLE